MKFGFFTAARHGIDVSIKLSIIKISFWLRLPQCICKAGRCFFFVPVCITLQLLTLNCIWYLIARSPNLIFLELFPVHSVHTFWGSPVGLGFYLLTSLPSNQQSFNLHAYIIQWEMPIFVAWCSIIFLLLLFIPPGLFVTEWNGSQPWKLDYWKVLNET